MKLLLINTETNEVTDISSNLYFFEENFIKEMDENGECEDGHGNRYTIILSNVPITEDA